MKDGTNIVLIGFMGTGKSLVGKELARRLELGYVDTDELIEKKEGKAIPEIFAQKGEDYFRQREKEVIKEISKFKGYVISTGGGAVLSPENIKCLKENGYLVCLTANTEVILQRTKNQNGERPLLNGFRNKKKRIQELLKARKPYYQQADFTIDTSSLSIPQIVNAIIAVLPGRELKVRVGDRTYPIYVGGSIEETGKIASRLGLKGKILVISDRNVFPIYGKKVANSLQRKKFLVSSLVIPPGERYKSLSQAKKMYNFCIDLEMDRTSSILALGGGVVGDLSGFVAATFLRGVNFVVVPTSLLAQVDSSVGGKVGVNLPQGKNLVGCFYQPKFVLIDPGVLKTLPPRRVREGIAEVIKCAIIDNDNFFSYLEKNITRALKKDPHTLRFLINKAIQTKIKVVEQDEREEKGIRQILNFGHTLGHAIEKASGYRRYTHGEAVAIGMVGESMIAEKIGLFSPSGLQNLIRLLVRAKLPVKAKGVDAEKIFRALKVDKKIREGKQVFALPEAIGRIVLVDEIPQSLVRKVIQEIVS